MVLRNKIHYFLLSTLILSACNENRDDNIIAPKIPTTTLQGVVLTTGYIQNARVCLDTNKNLLCDTSEPQTLTNAQGQYTLKNITVVDSQRYAVIAKITADAIVASTFSAIIKPYTLSSPIGYHQVISPLSTVTEAAQHLIPATAKHTAELIRDDLGFNKDIDILTNYLQYQNNVPYQRLQNFAYGISYVLSNNLSSLNTANNNNYQTTFRLVARNTLDEFIRTADYVSETGAQEALVYLLQNWQLAAYIPIEQTLKAVIEPETLTYKDINNVFTPMYYVYSECALYNLPIGCDVPYKNTLIYQITGIQQNKLSGTRYSYNTVTGTSTLIPESSNYHSLELKQNQWVAYQPENRTLSSKNTVYNFDVSNYNIHNVVKFFSGQINSYNNFNFSNVSFPQNSHFFINDIASNTPKTGYILPDQTNNNATFEPALPSYTSNYSAVNVTPFEANTITDFINFFKTQELTISRNSTIGETQNGQIINYERIVYLTATFDNNGTLHLKRRISGANIMTEVQTLDNGSWFMGKLANQDTLFIKLPASLANNQTESDIFYTLWNNQIARGYTYQTSGASRGFAMNQTAFNALTASMSLR